MKIDFLSWHSTMWLGGLQAPTLAQFLLVSNENAQGDWGLIVCPGSQSHLTTSVTWNHQYPQPLSHPRDSSTLPYQQIRQARQLLWDHGGLTTRGQRATSTTPPYSGGDQGLENLPKLLLSE